MSKGFTSTITGAALFITAMAILSRSIGFIREVIFAAIFGLNKEFDIYLVGAVLPVIINTAVLYLSQNYFIPSYHQISVSDAETRKNFFIETLRRIFLYSMALSVLLFLCKSFIINSYLWNSSSAEKEIAENIFFIFIVTIPLNALYSVFTAYKQALSEFNLPAITHLMLNIPVIVCVLFLNKDWGIYTITVGYLLGNLIQLLVLFTYIIKDINIKELFIIKKRKKQVVLSSYLWIIIIIEVTNQLYIFIDRYFFNYIQPGGIASLNYAGVLYLLPVSILSFSLSTVVFPRFSESFNQNNFVLLNKYFHKSLRIISFLFIPVTIVYILDGFILIKFLFERGEFRRSDTAITFEALKMYSISLIFYAAYSVVNKMIYSLRMLKQLLVISIILLLLKVFLNFIFVYKLSQNGLALSTTISYIVIFVLTIVFVYKKIKHTNRYMLVKEIVLFALCGIMSYYISSSIIDLLSLNYIYLSILKILLFAILYLLFTFSLKLDLSFTRN